MENLIILANAGVRIYLYGPGAVSRQWYLKLEKTDAGATLSVIEEGANCEDVIGAAYAKWVRLTQNIPTHNLRQIEAPKGTAYLNDEIPF